MSRRLILSLLLILGVLAAGPLLAGPPVEPPDDCAQCGMNRTKFAHSRMLIEYEDGSVCGTCSINCTAIDLAANGAKKVKALKAGDYASKELIDARSATWTIGGDKRGVMTPVAKWAFAGKGDAERFVTKHGGKLATYEDALAATRTELAADQGDEAGGGVVCDCCKNKKKPQEKEKP
jgi:nitrous oxide reductase accessory protein NosL